MQRRPLPGYRHTATSLRRQRLDASPPRPRAVAPVMPCHPIHRIDRRGPLPCRLTDPHWPRIVRASVPRSQLDSQGGTQMHTRWATTGQPAKSSAPLPRCQLARTGAVPPRGPGSTTPHPNPRPGLGHPATGQVIRSPPMLPTGKGQGTLKSHPLARTKGRRRPPAPSTTPSSYPGTSPQTGCPPGLPATQALRLALSGKGPRPVHPANWRRVLDVESRPSSTCDARGRSLGESPPPSARRCRGTLMGRCVLHKSSQGSG